MDNMLSVGLPGSCGMRDIQQRSFVVAEWALTFDVLYYCILVYGSVSSSLYLMAVSPCQSQP